MAKKEYEKPVWSYADSMGPAIYYGHAPEFNGLVPPYKGTSDEWRGQPERALAPGYRLARECGSNTQIRLLAPPWIPIPPPA